MKAYEKTIEKLILISAIVTTVSVALITVFIFKTGMPIVLKYRVLDFITGTDWSPTNNIFGIMPLIIGTLAVTLGALIIGVPTGIACAVYLSEIDSKKNSGPFKASI